MSQTLITQDLLPEWDLSALYDSETDPQFLKDKEALLKRAQQFEAEYKQVLASPQLSANNLYSAISIYQDLSQLMGKIYSYVGLRYYKNALDEKNIQLYQQTQEEMTIVESHLIFFSLAINEIDKTTIENLCNDLPELKLFSPFLEKVQSHKPFQKSHEVEQVLLDKSLTANNAWVRLYDETMADQTFYIDDQPYKMASITSMMGDSNPTQRRKAAMALSQGLEKNVKLFAFITNTLAKDKATTDKLRGYKDAMHSRHIANQVESEVVEALVETVRAYYGRISHRYYKLKAKLMGVEKLQYWDRNAPLPFAQDQQYSWTQAMQIVYDAYHSFSPQIAQMVQQFFDYHWIDAPLTPGKSDGAFAHPTVPSAHPFILVNYTGTKRDIMTLAHELGHGVHQMFAYKQGYLLSDTPLTLAETASVFGEMLTFQNLLRNATSKQEKQVLLASKIDDMINTVIRQIAFHTFEKEVHQRRLEKELSISELNEIWLSTQQEALGDAVHLDPLVGNYWAYISHFIHVPFYVYAYAFADCIVNSLYQVSQNQPEGFEEKYIEMLTAGGSLKHKDLLAPFGLDASQEDFWKQGLTLIETMIDELEALSHDDIKA